MNLNLEKIPAVSNLLQIPAVRRGLAGSVFFCLFVMVLSADLITEKVSVDIGQVSERDIVASRTMSYVNPAKTQKLETEVLAGVSAVYDLDVSVIARQEETVTAVYRVVREQTGEAGLTLAQKTESILARIPVPLPRTLAADLAQLSHGDLDGTEPAVKNLLRQYLQRGIRDNEIEIIRKQIPAEVGQLGLASKEEAVVAGMTQNLLQPNFIFNERETDKRKKAALASVEPVRETVKKGQVLVRKGDVVTAEQIQIMEELGLHQGELQLSRIAGLAVLVLVLITLLVFYFYQFANPVYQSEAKLLLIGLISWVTLLLVKVAHYYSDFAAPIAVGGVLTALLVNPRVGLIISVALSVLFGVIADQDLRVVTFALMGSVAGVFSVSRFTAHGYSLARAGFWIAGINCLIIIATGCIEQIDSALVLREAAKGVFSGIAAAVIATGLLPYLENTFHITTPIKLLDIAKPNHPLLQRLLLEAPGTYHHSILVGNLAETAADVIGADPVVARVGAYYHDIGKIKRPYFFVENQTDPENPHDKIAPTLSTLIITSHVKDGLDLCREHKLPQVIADMIQQHHGTSLVSYFYKLATENEHSECIVEEDFRYEGPRPQTKEVALVMLADVCEAAVRSLAKPNVNRIEATVRKMIRERLHDGQLDDCNLTLHDLQTIGDVFIRVLSSMFHKRIEYPDMKELEKRKKNGNNHKQF
ncbi:HD family phosphohydrolase [Acetonema longum]|uniref:7TM receptor with intracellular metal dependent phosphohydrolase n=1 Tax=Acetonema longum DSM 6540 TaxID=1009370 RepID=F7NKX8_9FIRM|nr:HDIG domain-containing metalloprotein [Acetonema longum]EGO63321.1 7TM receptor with intracellular metal dependent phosphohydrolase [Acetonema longum DSM 6540]